MVEHFNVGLVFVSFSDYVERIGGARGRNNAS